MQEQCHLAIPDELVTRGQNILELQMWHEGLLKHRWAPCGCLSFSSTIWCRIYVPCRFFGAPSPQLSFSHQPHSAVVVYSSVSYCCTSFKWSCWQKLSLSPHPLSRAASAAVCSYRHLVTRKTTCRLRAVQYDWTCYVLQDCCTTA